jgi:VWFA-related protein
MSRKFISLFLCIFFTWSPLSIASPQPQDASIPNLEQSTVIRSTTHLVQVSVVVQNKKGEPVTGLKKEDFTILDEGKPQNIAFFTAAAPAPVAPPRALPPNIFTNRFDLKGQEPGAVTVILFDSLNTSSPDQSNVRRQVLRFLQSIKPQDHFAIYALTTQLRILHDFTQDDSALVDAVKHFTPQELAAFDASTTSANDLVGFTGDPQWMQFQNALNSADNQISQQNIKNRVGTTVGALEAIANHVSTIPGRKSLIWVSGGFPLDLGVVEIGKPSNGTPQTPDATTGCKNTVNQLPCAGTADFDTFAADVKRAAQALNRANMSIYPVDAQGVIGPSGISPGGSSGSIAPIGRGASTSQTNLGFAAEQNNRDSSKLLADETGGQAFFGNNQIDDAMRHALDDGRFAYTIGYYPDHGKWDGKFRKIKLAVNAGDSHLRYRKGYWASSERADTENEVKEDLKEAALGPLEATNLGVTVSALREPPASARTLQLQIGLDPKQLLLQPSENHTKGAVDLYFLQRNLDGETVSAEQQHLGLNLEDKQYEALAKTGIIFQRHVIVLAQTTEIRLVVRDAASGALGSVTIPSKIFFPTIEGASKPPAKPE